MTHQPKQIKTRANRLGQSLHFHTSSLECHLQGTLPPRNDAIFPLHVLLGRLEELEIVSANQMCNGKVKLAVGETSNGSKSASALFTSLRTIPRSRGLELYQAYRDTYFIPRQFLDPLEKLTMYFSKSGSLFSQRSGWNLSGSGNTVGFMLCIKILDDTIVCTRSLVCQQIR